MWCTSTFLLRRKFLSQIYTLFKSFFLSQIRQLEKRTNAKYAQPYLRFRLGSQPSPFGWARGEGEIFLHPVPPDSLSVTGTRTLSRPPPPTSLVTAQPDILSPPARPTHALTRLLLFPEPLFSSTLELKRGISDF